MPKKEKILPELKKLENSIGEFMQYWGFKKVHGRIWAHLYTSKGPLDSEALMKRLGLSKGMMSIAIRDLLKHQVILADHVGKHGVTFYKANPDIMGVISRVLRTREMEMLGQTEHICECLLKISEEEIEEAQMDRSKCEDILKVTVSAKRLLELFVYQVQAQDMGLFDQLGSLDDRPEGST